MILHSLLSGGIVQWSFIVHLLQYLFCSVLLFCSTDTVTFQKEAVQAVTVSHTFCSGGGACRAGTCLFVPFCYIDWGYTYSTFLLTLVILWVGAVTGGWPHLFPTDCCFIGVFWRMEYYALFPVVVVEGLTLRWCCSFVLPLFLLFPFIDTYCYCVPFSDLFYFVVFCLLLMTGDLICC